MIFREENIIEKIIDYDRKLTFFIRDSETSRFRDFSLILLSTDFDKKKFNTIFRRYFFIL